MVKSINQEKDPSGIKTYKYGDFRVEILPYFLYELSINKYWKNGFSTLEHKLIRSNKPLKIKTYSEVRPYKGSLIEREISVLAVTEDFLRENNLPEYSLNVKHKKCKKSGK